jgi:mono/diheme cytochrome c family protein
VIDEKKRAVDGEFVRGQLPTGDRAKGAKYGTQGQGTGRMPGFGNMLTDEQIAAIAEYVRSL